MKKIALVIPVAASMLLLVLMGRSATLALPPAGDFSINCTQDTLRTRPGWAPVKFLLSLVANNGYQGTVHLACVTLNPHLTCPADRPFRTQPLPALQSREGTADTGENGCLFCIRCRGLLLSGT